MKRILLFLLPLLIGISIALLVWNHLWLPFSNPFHITSEIASIGFNPTNNTIRFLVLIASPIIILLLASRFYSKSYKTLSIVENPILTFPKPKKHISILITSIVAILFGLASPTFIASEKFDPFHEGESLGPAISVQAGQIPYKDYVMIHGVYQDPMRSVIAFSIFGRSIGAVRTYESIIKLIMWVLFGLFLLQVFDWQIVQSVFVLGCLGILSSIKAITIMPRDITSILYLMSFPVFLRAISSKDVHKIPFVAASFALVFLPIIGLGMSVDRGVYYGAMSLVFVPLLYFFYFKKSYYNTLFLIGLLGGSCVGFFILGQILHWNFSGFIEFCFVRMPEYKDLMDGFVYTMFAPRFGIPALTYPIATYIIIWKFLEYSRYSSLSLYQTLKDFVAKYLNEFAVLLFALLIFRSALGRADWTHINYSWFGILSYIFIVFSKDILPILQSKIQYLQNGIVIFSILLLLCIFPSYLIAKRQALSDNFPLGTKDIEFIPEKDKPAIDFLQKNLGKNDDFLTLTDEAIWYYYLNKPCPIRFNIVMHAIHPAFQHEIVDSLQKRNVKFVLYHNLHWANFAEPSAKNKILPIFMEYFYRNFKPYRTINDNEIWIKSSFIDSKTILN
ncbi:MAG: hypothetical protein JST20_04365 [Bacteroidetes bacterium]|nr:hypothetical protein [Bacteroidota bacterium]